MSTSNPNSAKNAPLKLAFVGAGARANAYARCIQDKPHRSKIVAVADPDPLRRNTLADAHGVPAEMRFESYEDIAARPAIADAVLNATMDRLHYTSAMALLKAGWDMLLEKPVAPTEREVREIIETAQSLNRTVMVCHCLRYVPFYLKIKELLDSGRIGRIMSLNANECVSYDHMAGAFVRGKWHNTAESNPMILAKCCHDLDLIVWLMSGVAPRRVSSFGSLMHFRPESAPPGSGTRCLLDCKIERSCPYSAGTLNLRRISPEAAKAADPTGFIDDAAVLQDIEALKTTSPWGRCVWHCDNDVVDHQNVLIEFENQATASFDMFTNAARKAREMHIIGTLGQVQGELHDGIITVRNFKPEVMGRSYSEEKIDVGGAYKMHSIADPLLLDDFISVMKGEPTGRAYTRIQDSLLGHQVAFAAEESRLAGKVVEMGLENG